MKPWSPLLGLLLAAQLSVSAAAQGWDPNERDTASDRVEDEITRRYGDDPDPVSYDTLVARIFYRLADNAERQDVQYQLQMVEDEEINAYALPDGRVVFLTGLLRALPQGDEDAIAFVAAHEISHVDRHHAEKLATRSGLTGIALDWLTRSQSSWVQLLGGLTNNLLTSGYSRGMEAEADRSALAMMQRAGYEPEGALVTLKLFKDLAEERSGLRIFPTHPTPEDRYEDVLAYLREEGMAMPVGAVLSNGGVLTVDLEPTVQLAERVRRFADQAPRAGQGSAEAPRRAINELAVALQEFQQTLDWDGGNEADAFLRVDRAFDDWRATRDTLYFTTTQRQTVRQMEEQVANLTDAYLTRRATNVSELARYLAQNTAQRRGGASEELMELARVAERTANAIGQPGERDAALNLQAQRIRWERIRASMTMDKEYAEIVDRLDNELQALEVALGVGVPSALDDEDAEP